MPHQRRRACESFAALAVALGTLGRVRGRARCGLVLCPRKVRSGGAQLGNRAPEQDQSAEHQRPADHRRYWMSNTI